MEGTLISKKQKLVSDIIFFNKNMYTTDASTNDTFTVTPILKCLEYLLVNWVLEILRVFWYFWVWRVIL